LDFEARNDVRVGIQMSEISKAAKDNLYTDLREAAIVIDDAEQAAKLRKGDSNFTHATGIVRSLRRAVEATEERETIMRNLKEADEYLGLIGGSATDAVHAARQLIGEAHYRLAQGR
jgi:hypothetical protein